eukprot:1436215-Rhodomonas_salina.2
MLPDLHVAAATLERPPPIGMHRPYDTSCVSPRQARTDPTGRLPPGIVHSAPHTDARCQHGRWQSKAHFEMKNRKRRSWSNARDSRLSQWKASPAPASSSPRNCTRLQLSENGSPGASRTWVRAERKVAARERNIGKTGGSKRRGEGKGIKRGRVGTKGGGNGRERAYHAGRKRRATSGWKRIQAMLATVTIRMKPTMIDTTCGSSAARVSSAPRTTCTPEATHLIERRRMARRWGAQLQLQTLHTTHAKCDREQTA